jgi:hypothetical protein
MRGGNWSVVLAESAAGMVKIVSELDVEGSGRFMDYVGGRGNTPLKNNNGFPGARVAVLVGK